MGRHAKRFLTIDGQTKSVADWQRIAGISHGTLNHRIKAGLSPADAVFGPRRAQYTLYDTQTDLPLVSGTAQECADYLGLSVHRIYEWRCRPTKKYYTVRDKVSGEEVLEYGNL